MNMKYVIDQFLADKHLAIIGVSREKNQWGHMLMQSFSKMNYQIYPVNPNAETIDGMRCVADVSLLPKHVKNAIVTLPYQKTKELIMSISNNKLDRMWLPTKGCKTDQAYKELIPILRSKNIDAVYDVCPMMFFYPHHIHKLHFKISKFMKCLPKDVL